MPPIVFCMLWGAVGTAVVVLAYTEARLRRRRRQANRPPMSRSDLVAEMRADMPDMTHLLETTSLHILWLQGHLDEPPDVDDLDESDRSRYDQWAEWMERGCPSPFDFEHQQQTLERLQTALLPDDDEKK